MAWLFLLAYLIFGLIVASLFYAWWNRGLKSAAFGVEAVTQPGPHSPRDLIPDRLSRAAPHGEAVFEGDEAAIVLRISGTRGARGPARLAGQISGTTVVAATGVIPPGGWSETKAVGGLRRGPLFGRGWRLDSGDLLGMFANPTVRLESEGRLVLPVFTSFASGPRVRELEANIAAPRAGSGSEVFGVREYMPGDALRRIHWRSTARRGELVVREFEPPGVVTLGILCDPNPPSQDAADQVARIAASEAWDCVSGGGRVVLWAPGCEPTGPDEARSLWALLEWLARYPDRSSAGDMPPVTDIVLVTASPARELVEALEEVRMRGGSARAWAVGDVELVVDAPVQRAGLTWPL